MSSISRLILNRSVQGQIEKLATNLPQGVLLTGEEGVGLGTIASSIARSQTKNVLMVAPEKGVITIDKIRELYGVARTNTGLTVIIIDDADTMGREASNALLKLLEEPGENVRFVLTSHSPDTLLPTILSRVQTVAVPHVSANQTTALLGSFSITDATVRSRLSFIADGLPAMISRLVRDEAALTERSKTVRDARAFLSGSREERLVLAASYGTDRPAARGLIRDMMRLIRLSARGGPDEKTVDMLETLLAAERDLSENSSVRLSLAYVALTV